MLFELYFETPTYRLGSAMLLVREMIVDGRIDVAHVI